MCFNTSELSMLISDYSSGAKSEWFLVQVPLPWDMQNINGSTYSKTWVEYAGTMVHLVKTKALMDIIIRQEFQCLCKLVKRRL